MELKDTLVTGATVLAVGTSSVVGGNQVMDKVNKGPEKRRDATVERVMMELQPYICLLYTSPSPRDATLSRMPSSA